VRWAKVAELPQSIPEKGYAAKAPQRESSAGADLRQCAPRPNQLQADGRTGWGGWVSSACAEKLIKLASKTSAHLLNEAEGQGTQHGQATAKLGSGLAQLCALAVCEGVAG
jgi:hypothetical protein